MVQQNTQTFDQAVQVTPGSTDVAAQTVPGASPSIVAPTVPGAKMVPESDLIAVKKGLEKLLDDLRLSSAAELTESKRQSDAHYQSMLREQGSREELEKKVLELSSRVTASEDAEKKIKEATDSRDYLANQMVDLKKAALTHTYPTVTMESLEGKSYQELNTLEEALKLVGGRPAASNYDAAGSGGSSTLAGNEGLRAAIDEAKQRK